MIVALPRLSLTSITAQAVPESLHTSWKTLAGEHFMSQPEWLLAAWNFRHRFEPGVAADGGLVQSVSNPAGELLGIAPWYLQRRKGLRILRLIGSGAICSDYAKFPSSGQVAGLVAREFGQSLACSHGQGDKSTVRADVVEIEGHIAGCPDWGEFFRVLESEGWTRRSALTEGSWQIQLPASWEQYEQLLHRGRRRKARRAIKMLNRGEIVHQVIRDIDGIRACWPDFVRLHQMRRNALGQPGCFSDATFSAFLANATQDFAGQGQAWISSVEKDGRPLAMLLMFDAGKTTCMYQSGIDMDRIRLEPGHLVNACTIHEAIRQGTVTFDWLRGDELYKRGWAAQRIPLARTRLFAPGLRGRGAAAWDRLRTALRDRFSVSPVSPATAEGDDDDQE